MALSNEWTPDRRLRHAEFKNLRAELKPRRFAASEMNFGNVGPTASRFRNSNVQVKGCFLSYSGLGLCLFTATTRSPSSIFTQQ
jgi:hypothetical protein